MVGITCGGGPLLADSASSHQYGVNGANGANRKFGSTTVVNGEGHGEGGRAIPLSQYFLITPSLSPSLKYARRMRVLCIASGEHVPEKAYKVDFRACKELARGLRREVALT